MKELVSLVELLRWPVVIFFIVFGGFRFVKGAMRESLDKAFNRMFGGEPKKIIANLKADIIKEVKESLKDK